MNNLTVVRTVVAIGFAVIFLVCPLILTAFVVMIFGSGYLYSETERYLRERNG